mmetsp:Transcript_9842/g.18378  ORF Transcript_9842/g.18378 Transcript_9842/m.18378 type:complete len:91 (+) Transcript_9842:83-355(+)
MNVASIEDDNLFAFPLDNSTWHSLMDNISADMRLSTQTSGSQLKNSLSLSEISLDDSSDDSSDDLSLDVVTSSTTRLLDRRRILDDDNDE